MKKQSITIFILLISFYVHAQSVKNSQLQNKLVNEGFGNFTFYNDGSYTYYYKERSESLEFEGTYAIDSDVIHFLTVKSIKINGYENDRTSLELGIPGKYKIDYERTNSMYKGALVNIDTGTAYFSNIKITTGNVTNIDGNECILYPEEPGNRKYAVLQENLKIRKQPSTKAETVTINGYETDVGYSYEERSIEFAGSVLWIKAKSVKEDTIDGITAPWYYICCSSELNNFDGWPTFAWIYGGYVTEISENEYEKYKNENKPLLIKKLIEAGAEVTK